MANIKSAKKRIRQNEKRKENNAYKKATIRTYEKKFKKSLEQSNFEDAEKFYRLYTSSVDKAAKTNLYHPNKAGRKKSRLAKMMQKAKGGNSQVEASPAAVEQQPVEAAAEA